MWPAVLLLALVAATLPPAPAHAATRVFALGGPAVLSERALDAAADDLHAEPSRIAGPDRYATAVALSRHAHPGPVRTLYVVGAEATADALAPGAAVAVAQAAILPTSRGELPDSIAHEVARLAPERVWVVGGTGAVSEAVRQRLAQLTGRTVRRLAAADRYATAALLARHARPDGAEVVYVAAGHASADGFAALNGAAARGAPLLLTEPDRLTASAADELRRLQPAEIVVVGGRAAVADAVLGEITRATGITPLRMAGADRVATSEAVARHAHGALPDTLYLASATHPADAMAVAAALVAHDAGLLLVDPDPRVRWVPQLDPAIAFAGSRAGSVSFAVIGTDGVLRGHRARTRVPAASVLKVMFMAAYLRQPSVAGRELTDSDRALLEPMIRRSANEPATAIANRLGPGPMEQLATEAGMRDFSYTRPWGLSRTSARDQARFLLDLERHLPARHRAYALRLLTEVVPEQRWGIGALATPGWTQHFKGGWGSGSGAVDHQVVQLRHRDGTRVALAVMTTGSPSHGYGTDTLREVFRRLLAGLP